MRLTEKHLDVLQYLASHRRSFERGNGTLEWALPMELGAWDGSHHSGTLRTLAIHGLAERKHRYFPDPQTPEEVKTGRRHRDGKTYRLRGPYRYRITDAGLAALKQEEGTTT